MSEDDYYIDTGIDGHPICFGGIIQGKATILQDLNALSGTTRALYAERKTYTDQQATIDKLVTVLKKLTEETYKATNPTYTASRILQIEAEDLINSVTEGE